jgi:hypothetical protein
MSNYPLSDDMRDQKLFDVFSVGSQLLSITVKEKGATYLIPLYVVSSKYLYISFLVIAMKAF